MTDWDLISQLVMVQGLEEGAGQGKNSVCPGLATALTFCKDGGGVHK